MGPVETPEGDGDPKGGSSSHFAVTAPSEPGHFRVVL